MQEVVDRPPVLTRRQMQMLAMVAMGKTMHEIALELFVSYHTVDHTLRHARERLNVCTTIHAVSKAVAFEILSLDPDGNVGVPERYNYLAA